MNISLEFILIILFVISATIIILIGFIVYNKWANSNYAIYETELINYIAKSFKHADLSKKALAQNQFLTNQELFLKKYIDLKQILNDSSIDIKVNEFFQLKQLDKKYLRQLNSKSERKRIEAAVYLSYMNLPKVVDALEKRLKNENKDLVKLYLVEALVRQKQKSSIPTIIQTIYNANNWYKDRVFVLLSDFDELLYHYICSNLSNTKFEFRQMVIHFAENYPAEILKNYLITTASFNVEEFFDLDLITIPENFSIQNEANNKNVSEESKNFIKQLYCPNEVRNILKLISNNEINLSEPVDLIMKFGGNFNLSF